MRSIVLFLLCSIHLLAVTLQDIEALQKKMIEADSSRITKDASVNFNKGLLSQGLSNLTPEDLKSRSIQTNAPNAVIGGFKCPPLDSIKDASIDTKAKHQVQITDVDFVTGKYTCHYNFANKQGFYELKRVNPMIEKEAKDINKTDPTKTSLQLSGTYGLYQLEKPLNVGQDFQSLNGSLIRALNEVTNTYDQLGSSLDLKSAINSSSHHAETLGALLIGVVTADQELLGKFPIDSSGELNLQEFAAGGINQNGSVTSTSTDRILSVVDGLDKKFWGYYYILSHNINEAFKEIIMMIFSAGAVYSIAFFIFFNYKGEHGITRSVLHSRFYLVFFTWVCFSAPIVPGNLMPNQYDFSNKESNNKSYNSTPIQIGLRYVFQTGTYWANKLNDAALFSYLKYVSSEYGHYNPTGVQEQFVRDTKSFLQNSKTLENKISFFESTCAVNYSNQLLKNNGLPDYSKSVMNVGVNFFDANNALGIHAAEYSMCANLFHQIQQESGSHLIQYRDILHHYDSLSENLIDLKTTDIKELNEFLNFVVNVNNRYGWISALMVPSITHLLETKQILKYTDAREETFEAINSSLGTMKTNESALDATEKQLKEVIGEPSPNKEISWWDAALKKMGVFKDENIDPIFNFTSKYIAAPTIGAAVGYTIYSLFPGFDEIFKQIAGSGIVPQIMNGISNIATIIIPGGSSIGTLVSTGTNMLSSISKAVGLGPIVVYIATYMVTVFFYTFIVSTVSLVLITLFIILKIIFFYLDILISFFISAAIMVWALVFNHEKAIGGVLKFLSKTLILGLTPLSIVMSVYVYMFCRAILYYLWRNFIELIYSVSDITQHSLDSETISGTFTMIQTYAIYSISEIIFMFISIYVAYIVLFKFHDRLLEYFGYEGGSGIAGYAQKVFESMQGKLTKA